MSKSYRDRQNFFLCKQKDSMGLFERKANPEQFIDPNDLPQDVKNRTFRNSYDHTFVRLSDGSPIPNVRNAEAKLKLRLRRNERAKNKVIMKKIIESY